MGPGGLLDKGKAFLGEEGAHGGDGGGFVGPAVDAGTAESANGVEGGGIMGAVAQVGFEDGVEHELA